MTIEIERRLFVEQLIEDATAPTRLNHEGRAAAVLLAFDLHENKRPGIRYSKTVGEMTAHAEHSFEACMLSAEVQALIDELNLCGSE